MSSHALIFTSQPRSTPVGPFLAPRWSAANPSHRSCAVPLSLFEYFTFLLSLMRDAALSSHCVHACGSAGMPVLGAWCDGACVWPLTPVCPPVPACLSQNDAVWTHLTEVGITCMAIRVLSPSRLIPCLVCLLLRSCSSFGALCVLLCASFISPPCLEWLKKAFIYFSLFLQRLVN